MVILGLERPVEYGSRLIFDPTMANMVLQALNNYILAMKEDYLRGREDLKEFNKNFGDFFSPILKDMEWYDKNVTGATRDLINDLYSKGMDLRSPEFRAVISRWVNNMPTGKINQLKLSAEAAKEYLKNKGALEAAGRFNLDFEDFVNKGLSLDNWDTARNGMWTKTSPAEIKSLKELTESSYNNRTPHDLTKEEVLSFDGQTYDPRMRYKGFTDADLLNIANTIAPGLTGTPWLDYYRELAKRQVAASGKELNSDNINAQLARNIANSQLEYLIKPIGDLSDWYQQQLLNISRQRLNHETSKDNPTNNPIIGFTDRVKDAINQKQKTGSSGSSKYKTKYVPIDAKTIGAALLNWDSKTVTPDGYDQQLGAKQIFFGYTERSQEAMDAISGRKSVRFTFVPNSGLHYTPVRMYDYDGKAVRGNSKMFDDYLHKHQVYGFPVDEPVSITHDAQGNSNIYDANGYLQIRGDQIEGYFKERWNAKTHRDDYDSDDYEDYKKRQMKQLGIVENAQVTSKNYVEVDGKGVNVPKVETYYTIPVSRTAYITGLGQSAIDTFVDKGIMSGEKLGERETRYLVRDYKRRSR